jgi:glutamine cyclotransferase
MKQCCALLLMHFLLWAACADTPERQPVRDAVVARAIRIPQLRVEVLRRIPHSSDSYTQGLVLGTAGLYESTGRYGKSTIRVLDPSSGKVLRSESLPSSVFGEGVAETPAGLVQLTWKESTAFYYDPSTLRPIRTAQYSGEGWGLCYDGEYLYMSSGTDQIVRRDPASFEPLEVIRVTAAGRSLGFLNELECVGDDIWANVQISRVQGK